MIISSHAKIQEGQIYKYHQNDNAHSTFSDLPLLTCACILPVITTVFCFAAAATGKFPLVGPGAKCAHKFPPEECMRVMSL